MKTGNIFSSYMLGNWGRLNELLHSWRKYNVTEKQDRKGLVGLSSLFSIANSLSLTLCSVTLENIYSMGATRYVPAHVDKLYTTKKANGRMRWGESKVLLNSWQHPWKAREFLGFVAAPFQLLPAERLAQPSLCWQWTILALIILGINVNKKCCKGFAFSCKILKNRQPWLVLVTLLNVFKPSWYMATAGCRYFTFNK